MPSRVLRVYSESSWIPGVPLNLPGLGAARHQRTQVFATRTELPIPKPFQGTGVERAVRAFVRRRNQSTLPVVKRTLAANVERVYPSIAYQPESMY